MRILITGAYGFVGTNLCHYLVSRGHSCDALDIYEAQSDGVGYEASYTWDDLSNKNTLIPFSEYDAIVHLAGKAHDLKKVASVQSYFDINVGLTEKIFNASYGKVPRFIYFSSSKASKDGNAYGRSKYAAEVFLDGRAIILRPAMIHGRGNKGNLNLLWKLAKFGFPWPLAAFENKRSFSSIQNVCISVESLCERGVNGIYPIADDETLSTNRIIELIAEACGKKPHLWHLSKRIMRGFAKLGDILHLPLNTERLEKLTEDSFVDNAELKKLLGWSKMPVSAEDGMRKTLASFVSKQSL